MKRLIVGLGNPGQEYEHSYHNLGFQALDYLTQGAVFSLEKEFLGEVYRKGNTYYLKPQTYMNQSGQSVQKLANYLEIQTKDIIIIHDDADISLGEYKIQLAKGSGGHKGVESVFNYLGNTIQRIRIGIRSDKFQGQKAASFVLQKISAEDSLILEKVFAEIQVYLRNEQNSYTI